MTPPILDQLEFWIRSCFDALAADPAHYPSFRTLFRRELREDLEKFATNFDEAEKLPVDDEDPESRTLREYYEERMKEDIYPQFAKALKEGHSVAYAEIFAHIFEDHGASEDAYNALRSTGASYGPEDPAYQEAKNVCLALGKPEECAVRCAERLEDYFGDFEAALRSVEDEDKARARMLAKGRSEFHATQYAEELRRGTAGDFAEVYATCAEEQLQGGRTHEDAIRFASIYVDLFDEYGSFDPDDDLSRDRCEAITEAHFRYRREYGEKTLFIDAFDQTFQCLQIGVAKDVAPGFDGMEAAALRVLKARELYLAEHGNLRGFDPYPRDAAAPSPDEPGEPKAPDYSRLSDAEFRSARVTTEEEEEAWEAEAEYRGWCTAHEMDHAEPESRAQYAEVCEEHGDAWWDGLDPHDRDGWTDNMNRDS